MLQTIFGKKEDVLMNDRSPSTSSDRGTDILEVVQETDKRQDLTTKKIESLEEKVLRDRSPEAKAGRRRMMYRAVYGEFMCTLLFYGPIFCCIANGYVSNWGSEFTTLAAAFVSGFQAIAICYAFSSVSGAQFNSAISFALWLTGKLSNRRVITYIAVQLCASIVGMIIVSCIFHGDMTKIYNAVAVQPVNDVYLGKVFATEFFMTFFLTYIAFTVAFEDAENQKKESMSFKTISDAKGLTLYTTTPQSKTGFAPFSIGLTIFSLNLLGGTSGSAFNPGRIFGPAIFSGKWDYVYIYWLGELFGAAAAGLLVNNIHRIGINTKRFGDAITAKDVIERSLQAPTKIKDEENTDN
jgi:glycerol uptake facilitator-like aquaporin